MNAVGGFLKETALQWAVRQGALEATVVLVRHLRRLNESRLRSCSL